MFLAKVKKTIGSVMHVQSKFHLRLNRNRRKKKMLRIYWDLVAKSCKDVSKDDGKAFISKFNGHKFHLMTDLVRFRTINKILYDQEFLYVKRLIQFQR